MKKIYQAVIAELKTQVPELNWVDLDRGQLDCYVGQPAVDFPCALVQVSLQACESVYPEAQQATIMVGICVVQNPSAAESGTMPTLGQAQARSEACYQLIEKVYRVLQGFDVGHVSPLSRIEQQKETRADGYFVYRVVFQALCNELVS